MEIVSYGNKSKIYRVKCPHCGTVIQAEKYEFHFFEGMYKYCQKRQTPVFECRAD